MSSASLSNEAIEERFFLTGRMEILNILNELIHRREPLTLYFQGGRESILTILLDARQDGLVFDLSGDTRSNRLLETSPGCVFVALPDGIRVQFSTQTPTRVRWGEHEALRVTLPERIVRLQRREFYRNVLPVVQSLTAQVWLDGKMHNWTLHDLSVGGFGAQVATAPEAKEGVRLSRILIPLSEKTHTECSGIIRHATTLERIGPTRLRIGVQFLDLSHADEVAIQRTIIRIEYERRKLRM